MIFHFFLSFPICIFTAPKVGAVIKCKNAGFKVVHCPGISTALLPVGAHHAALLPGRGIFVLSAHSICKVQLQLRKSSRWPPSCQGVYFERSLCYNGDNENIYCRCRRLNVSNLRFLFVWRMDKIYFRNSYCRIGGVKNERTD